MSQIRIGTSGWTYQHWRNVFYPLGLPPRRWLEYYAEEFDTVEVNATFYRLLAESTFTGWRKRTPEGFLFAVKASRPITHYKKLLDAGPELELFLFRAKLLLERIGPILFQLPPRWPCDRPRLRDFISSLPKGLQYAFEFRDQSWFCDPVYAILKDRGAALVQVAFPPSSQAEVATADFWYIRLHGESGSSSKYTDSTLRKWSQLILRWADKRDVFVYFNNDIHGYAVENARTLRELVGQRC